MAKTTVCITALAHTMQSTQSGNRIVSVKITLIIGTKTIS